MQYDLDRLVSKSIERERLTREEALTILRTPDDATLDVVSAAARVRRHFFGNRVKLNFIIDMKSGNCPEDCSYCAQRLGSQADILKYRWIDTASAADLADRALAGGASRVCLVAAGRGPSDREVSRLEETVRSIKRRAPAVEVCVCVGLLRDGQAERLRDAGVFAYNHNLNTSESHYGDICTTHTYRDRVATVRRAHQAGLSPCSGAIFGMGETDADIVDLAFDLRSLNPDSVPVNFLMPFDGTPLAGTWTLTPNRCLRILALFRFVFPDAEVRLAGGREIHLRSLQPLALHVANSMFLGDYLASEGQPASEDLRMIEDAGFTIQGFEPVDSRARPSVPVPVRRRGAGSERPPNV